MKLSESPVGNRTSTPTASLACSASQILPFARRVMSPIPEAVRLLVNTWWRQGNSQEFGTTENECTLLLELLTIVASEIICMRTFSMGMTIETSIRLVMPYGTEVVTR